MKHINSKPPSKSRLRTVLCLAVASAVFAPLALVVAADSKAELPSKTEKPTDQKSKANPSEKKPKSPPKKLTGAELYSMHCARCHPERYPNERTSAQWKTVAMHMRVRANLPAEQFRTLLKYLQENSGY